MATQLQEDLAEAIVKNRSLPRYKRKNKGELVRSVGYGRQSSIKKPTAIIEAKGVQETLNKWGLNEELITTALVDDIKNKPRKRFLEMSLGAEILGMKTKPKTEAPQQTITNNITQIIINPPYAAETGNQSDTETISSVASPTES